MLMVNKRKILFIDTVHAILEERLTSKGFLCVDGTKMSRDEIQSELKDSFGIVIRARFTLDKELLSFAKNLNHEASFQH